MKTKILVLGSTGMLGHMVLKVFSQEKTFAVDGTHLNNSDDEFYFDAEAGLGKLNSICSRNKGYDYFINCIGITQDKIDTKSSKSIMQAIRINSLFPHQLAEFAENKGIRIIHISTDGVFSGTAEYYDEDALCDCTDIYGKTKSLGEIIDSNFLIIRCSIIGPSPFEKRGLFEWFNSQPEGSQIPGYTNHFWNGVTTLQFAKLCQRIIQENHFDSILKESHIHHFCPNKPVSKYEILTIFEEILRKKIKIIPCEDKKSPVKRLLSTKYNGLKDLFGSNKNIQVAISELLKNHCKC